MNDPLTYKDAGVDLDAAERAKRAFAPLLDAAGDENTLSGLGAFGGLYAVPQGLSRPVLVASADGVGTKLKVAFLSGRHDTVGRDLVNHCVNDILVQGARPLFFLDYLATGRLDEGVAQEVVSGVSGACRENGCALLGGETAEMPDFYGSGEYDLAGFVVGIVERGRILDGSGVRPGDRLVAIRSSGLHTNGFTLARTIVFERMGLGVGDPFPGESASAGEVLLRVHRSYLNAVWPLLQRRLVRAMAHVTGGGIEGNLPRVLPSGLGARIDCGSWSVPNVFRQLSDAGGVAPDEMYRVFNMGVGMILVMAPDHEEAVLAALGGDAWSIGEVVRGTGVELQGVCWSG
ncbi:MAG: phosphoribosylformylglycinamidine cyclo-ligase [Gemmatimonadota bacterium]|nr:phosphoribosylformylglycinamidine cyclo-ligase [Gemmatimonadota bacterium]MDE2863615.1 phosphoribosylformylglycinamidine cyclo-ligase [Gemmatimonadota bacterium]MYB07159.1 phosphoribosylformylglycinamidine cyclo-ligase [Gemmatimonadota bacterium]MYE17345.1 phosphoribosylformylglycinamidine cyclo-ligase [Gemmatimonadota bacterium]MYG21492.1 phosphoribosylformylglycinamidine cyclo-ligase [Gemmatimonadota bacterium]